MWTGCATRASASLSVTEGSGGDGGAPAAIQRGFRRRHLNGFTRGRFRIPPLSAQVALPTRFPQKLVVVIRLIMISLPRGIAVTETVS